MEGTPPQQGKPTKRRVVQGITRIILLPAGAVVQGIEVNAMLEGTFLDKGALWDALVGGDETVSEAQGSDYGCPGVGVCRSREMGIGQVHSTQDQNVPDTFRWAMFADYFGGIV